MSATALVADLTPQKARQWPPACGEGPRPLRTSRIGYADAAVRPPRSQNLKPTGTHRVVDEDAAVVTAGGHQVVMGPEEGRLLDVRSAVAVPCREMWRKEVLIWLET